MPLNKKRIENIGQLANNRQLTIEDIKLLNEYGQTQKGCNMGIMKNQLIEELIEDEEAEIDFVELSIESARVELEVDMARERERERIQMEMYDDPYMNWSGQR